MVSTQHQGIDIQIQDLSVRFDTPRGYVYAVQAVNTTFPFGQITGMIGESGSGKSVMAMSILQLLSDSAQVTGQCHYGHLDLYALPESALERIRGKEIGLIPQNPTASINPMMKLKKQLMEPLLHHKLASKEEAQQIVYGLLREFGFEEPEKIGNRYAFELSGGMNQRVISAHGLVCNPPWIIADEPTKGLDSLMRNQVYRVLKQIHQSHGCGMLVITHDLLLAQRLCQRLCVTYSGQILEQGGCQAIFDQPLHPYTKALLEAQPHKGMHPIPPASTVPGASDSSSCPFYPRCSQASQHCLNRDMEDFPVDDGSAEGRKVRCFLYA